MLPGLSLVAGVGCGAWFCSHSNQSSPNSSTGCCVLSEPLPQRNDVAGQYWSQPQQLRSGCLGWTGNFLLISVFYTFAGCCRMPGWSIYGGSMGGFNVEEYCRVQRCLPVVVCADGFGVWPDADLAADVNHRQVVAAGVQAGGTHVGVQAVGCAGVVDRVEAKGGALGLQVLHHLAGIAAICAAIYMDIRCSGVNGRLFCVFLVCKIATDCYHCDDDDFFHLICCNRYFGGRGIKPGVFEPANLPWRCLP